MYKDVCKEYWATIGKRTQFATFQTEEIKKYFADEAKEIISRLSRNDTVLELGCGTGRFLAQLAASNLNLTLYGADFSAGTVAGIPRLYSDYSKISVLTADAGELPFTDSCLDAVILAFNTLGIVSEPCALQTIEEASRILRRGGRLLCSVYENSQRAVEAQKDLYTLADFKFSNQKNDRMLLDDQIYSRRFSEEGLREIIGKFPTFEASVNKMGHIGILLDARKVAM